MIKYETLLEEIDVFAERIRALGDYAPSCLAGILAMSSMPDDQDDHCDALKMVDLFLKNTHTVTEQAKKLCHLCEQHGDLVTQDRLIGFIYKMDEASWKAKSFMTSKA